MLSEIAARTALVLETNNLRGGADPQIVETSLLRVIRNLVGQTIPLSCLAQVIVTHDGLRPEFCGRLIEVAGRPIDFVQIDHSTNYYEAKNAGFAATDERRCDYVAFADSDCEPALNWLEELLVPLAHDNAPAAVAGRTSYAATVTGTALTTLDFMYFPSPLQEGATRNFYANNVIFRRDIFAQHSYEALKDVYRANCQVLGLYLQEMGIPLHYAPNAHTVHRLPDTRREVLQLRWMRGQDSHGLTPHLVRAYLPRHMQWLARSGPIGPLCVLGSRLWFSLRALNHQDLPALHGGRRLSAMVLILGFSAIDMLGALTRSLGWKTSSAPTTQTLSYHRS